MKLSKRERDFRIKLIQENHYDKTDQKILDEAVGEFGESYAGVYKDYRKGLVHCSSFKKLLKKSIQGTGYVVKSMDELTDEFIKYGDSLQEFLSAIYSF